MEHEGDSIPWNLLVAHLGYPTAEPSHRQVYNLFPKFDVGQGRDLNRFVDALASSINEHSRIERMRYQEIYDPPALDDILLTDNIVQRISPTGANVSRWLRRRRPDWSDQHQFNNPKSDWGGCGHDEDDMECICSISTEERKASAFLRQHVNNDCFNFIESNGPAYNNLEIVKSLLVSGDMEPVLRVCAHPDNDLLSWKSVGDCECTGGEYGWWHALERALESFVCLKLLHGVQLAARRDNDMNQYDYRRTQCYQRLLRGSVFNGTESIASLHLNFFGVHEHQYSEYPRPRKAGPFYSDLGEAIDTRSRSYLSGEKNYPYGMMPFNDFLEFEAEAPYQPAAYEIPAVLGLLREKRLPAEIALRIMEMAEWDEPRRLLKVPHDPLHRENEAELMSYLSICWDVLVRCDMMAKALGKPIQWNVQVSGCIVHLWGPEDTTVAQKMYRRLLPGSGLYEFL